MPALPHHHHRGAVCMEMECCAHTHAIDDRHTHHHGDCSTCQAESSFYLSKKSQTEHEEVAEGMQPAACISENTISFPTACNKAEWGLVCFLCHCKGETTEGRGPPSLIV